MPYTYAKFAQAKTALSARLYDTPATFWADAELGAYITEALRTWNSLTSFWRGEFLLSTQVGIVWYDITDITTAPNTLRPLTVTDTDIYNLIEYHLLEPATGAAWTGSAQFNAQDMIQAVQRRRDEILSATSCTITRQLLPAVPGRIYMQDNVLDIRRIAWLPVPVDSPPYYVNVPLWPDDTWSLQSYEPDFTIQTPGQPSTYRQSTEPPLSFDTDIPPAVPGQYDVLTVNAGSDLDPNTPQTLSMPDDFTWVLKWGALADMLNRESNAKDPVRAKYCNLRYVQGLALLQQSPAVLYTRIANLPLQIDSAQSMDNYRPGWQAESAAQPDACITTGLNLIGLAPTPDAGPYSITLMVVRNAPVPLLDADYIQLGRDEYDCMLDYAVHLASFKMGGSEFLSTMPLLQRFMTQAALYNSKLMGLGEFKDAMYELSQLQAQTNPVFSSIDPTSMAGNGNGQDGGNP